MVSMIVSLHDIRSEALRILRSIAVGEPLDEFTAALIGFAVRISVTSLDPQAAEPYAERALAAGASIAQLHEATFLVSALGVHSLFGGSRLIANLAEQRGDAAFSESFDAARQQVWDQRVGTDKYWASLEREVPGFLDAQLRLSTDGFDAFFRYCAVPWKSGLLPPLTKVLISMAVDATP